MKQALIPIVIVAIIHSTGFGMHGSQLQRAHVDMRARQELLWQIQLKQSHERNLAQAAAAAAAAAQQAQAAAAAAQQAQTTTEEQAQQK